MWRWLVLILLLLPPTACAAGWARSYFSHDLISLYHDGVRANAAVSRRYHVRSKGGVLALEVEHEDHSHEPFTALRASSRAVRPCLHGYANLGMEVSDAYRDAGSHRLGVPNGYLFSHQYSRGFRTVPLTAADVIGWHRAWWAPYWLVMLVAGLPAMLLSRQLGRGIAARRRRARGRCAACGYDLRASPQRCPECGRTKTSGAAGNLAPFNAGSGAALNEAAPRRSSDAVIGR